MKVVQVISQNAFCGVQVVKIIGATFSILKNPVFMGIVQVVKVISKKSYIEKISKKMLYREVYKTTFTTCTFMN